MRKIIHVDMDYFFAQVEILSRPELRDKPVAIGGGRDMRGVLSTCNYVARKFGVKSAMPTFLALRKCPDLILLNANFHKYREVSDIVIAIFKSYTDKIQVVSIDEAYLDVTDCSHFFNSATLIAQDIRKKIYEKTGLTASAGVSFNKMLAKVASEINKPDGIYIIDRKNYKTVIPSFDIRCINGVGKVMAKRLGEYGIFTFLDAQTFSKLDLINIVGSFGAILYDYCRGCDCREVEPVYERKSLSVERTFIENLREVDDLKLKLHFCYEEMIDRLLNHRERTKKTIFIKIKYKNFEQTTIEQACSGLGFEEFSLLFIKKFSEKVMDVRLIGLGVKFYSAELRGQLELELID